MTIDEKLKSITAKAFLIGFILGIISVLGVAVVIVKNGWFK